MAARPYCLVTGVLLALVATAHLLRALYGVPVFIGGYSVPMAVSWIGFIVPGALAYWAFRVANL